MLTGLSGNNIYVVKNALKSTSIIKVDLLKGEYFQSKADPQVCHTVINQDGSEHVESCRSLNEKEVFPVTLGTWNLAKMISDLQNGRHLKLENQDLVAILRQDLKQIVDLNKVDQEVAAIAQRDLDRMYFELHPKE